MDKLLEKLSQIDGEIGSDKLTFASEMEKMNNKATEHLNTIKEIRQEIFQMVLDLRSKIIPLETQVNSLNIDIKQKEDRAGQIIPAMEKKVEEINSAIDVKTKTVADLDDKIVKSQKIVESYITERDDITSSLSKARVSLDMAEVGAKKAANETAAAQRDLEQAKKELGDISNQKDILNADIRAKTTLVDDLKRSIDSLKFAELDAVKKRLAELQ